MKAKRAKIGLLLSGGYDSAVLLWELLEKGKDVYPLYARSGFFWERAELNALRRLLKRLGRPGLKPLMVLEAPMSWAMRRHWSVTGRGVPDEFTADERVFLPGRNLVLLTQAGLFCAAHGIGEVALAVLRGNPFPDSSPRFIKAMAQAISAALKINFSVTVPYARLGKADLSRRHGPDFPSHLTFSCIKPLGFKACGRCNKCFERRLMRPGLRS